MNNSAIVKIYGNRILDGKRELKSVPQNIYDDVVEYINSVDPNFLTENASK